MSQRLGLHIRSTAVCALSQSLRSFAMLLCGLLSSSTAFAAAAETNDYFSSLKQFLNTDLDQFEIVYSIIHHSNPTMVALTNQLTNGGIRTAQGASLVGMGRSLDAPLYHRIRLTSDGYFAHYALSLSNIQNRVAVEMMESITGFYSNAVWTSHARILDINKARAQEYSARDGPDW